MVTKGENDMRDAEAQKQLDEFNDSKRRVDAINRILAPMDPLYCNCCKTFIDRSIITTDVVLTHDIGKVTICPSCGEPESFTVTKPSATSKGPVRPITAEEFQQRESKAKVDEADRIISMEGVPEKPFARFEDVTIPRTFAVDTVLKCNECSNTFRQWKYVPMTVGNHRVFGVECPECKVVGTVKA